jgi:hypothetical protein
VILINFTARWRWMPNCGGQREHETWYWYVKWFGADITFYSRDMAEQLIGNFNRSVAALASRPGKESEGGK